MVAICVILYLEQILNLEYCIGLWIILNLVGYIKYLYQKYVDHEYITLSFYVYILSWTFISYLLGNICYLILFLYPMILIGKLKADENLTYGGMKKRKILYDEYSIALHSIDHLMHGFISLRLLIFYFNIPLFFVLEPFIILFIYQMSEVLLRLQTKYLYQPDTTTHIIS